MRYRDREGYWAWVLHRVSGLAILLFLLAHIADTALLTLGRDSYNHALDLYRHPAFRLGEVLLFAGVLYHALNGLRIIAIDLSEAAFRRQRQIWYGVVAISLAVMTPIGFIMLRPVLPGA